MCLVPLYEMNMKEKILLVEDSSVVLKVLKHLVGQNSNFEPVLANSYKAALEQIDIHGNDLFVAVVDLHLPDAENGEIVDAMLEKGIPCVVLTGTYDDNLRLSLLNKGVVDYVTKDSRYSYQHVMKVVERLRKNVAIKVLVAEDSTTSRNFIKTLLQQYRFQVIEAKDGQEALTILESDDTISMLITDHNMPIINGYDLVRMLRRNMRFQDLVIIGLSSEGDSSLTAKFIKSGANDFLKKPFYHEEFHCRVIHNLEAQEMLNTIRDLANLDALTGLYNRRYLMAEGESFYQGAVAAHRPIHVVMIDIDHFKQINDNYGHLIGDKLLEAFSELLSEFFSDSLVARFGGEEFCVLNDVCTVEGISQRLKALNECLDARSFTSEEVKVTYSGGVVSEVYENLEGAVKIADTRLYLAKNNGRNQVCSLSEVG